MYGLIGMEMSQDKEEWASGGATHTQQHEESHTNRKIVNWG